MPAPRPTRIFHITAIANLSAILVAGALLFHIGGKSSITDSAPGKRLALKP